LRTLGLVEGISTLALFGVAMPMKYVAGIPIAVTIAGSLHGLLFTALALMFILAIKKVPIPRRMAMLGIAAAIVPFGPFIMDRPLARIADTSRRDDRHNR
jgi:integral membrane protein